VRRLHVSDHCRDSENPVIPGNASARGLDTSDDNA
jgi:hypothetical protein